VSKSDADDLRESLVRNIKKWTRLNKWATNKGLSSAARDTAREIERLTDEIRKHEGTMTAKKDSADDKLVNFTVTMADLKPPGGHEHTEIKAWAKAITGVNLSQNGGWALEGKFLRPSKPSAHDTQHGIGDNLSPYWSARAGASTAFTSPGSSSHIFKGKVVEGQPVVLGVTLTDQKTSAQHRHAFVFEAIGDFMNSNYTPRSNITLGFECNTYFSGNLILSLHPDRKFVLTSDRFPVRKNGEELMSLEVNSVPFGHNAFKNAANFLDKHWERYEDIARRYESLTGRERGKPISLHPQEFIEHEGKIVHLPRGINFLTEMNGLWILGYNRNGHKDMTMLDILVNHIEEVQDNEDLLDFIEDQAGELEAMAMAYRLLAMAGKGSEDSQENKDEADDDSSWLL
jgi:hypothetical protein